MEELKRIRDSLIEENVRHLPDYAVNELMERIALALSEAISGDERELLLELKYILKRSPRCTVFTDELLT